MAGGLRPPLSVIASWPKPNYINPDTKSNALVIIVIILLILVPVVVAARIWARVVILKKPGWDDGLVLFALVPTIGLGVCFILSVTRYGFDRHIWDVPPSNWLPAALVAWVIELLYHVSTTFVKVSILLFYKRMSAGSSSKPFLRTVYAAIAFQVLWGFVFTVILCSACRPLNAYWLRLSLTPYTKPHSCIKEGIYWPLSVGISTVTDFVATLLPCWFFWHLQLPLRQKLSLYGIFCLGFLTCIAGVCRFILVLRELNWTYDVFWTGYDVWLVSALEVNGTILCASAPALKPLYDKYFAAIPSGLFVRSVKELSWSSSDQTRTPGRTTPAFTGDKGPERESMALREISPSRHGKADIEFHAQNIDIHELLKVPGEASSPWPLP